MVANGRFLKSTRASGVDLPPALTDASFLQWVSRTMVGVVMDAADGQLAAMARHHFRQQGKMLRPQFVQKLGQCYDLPVKFTLDWAVACELLHNATLIHDDLQDGDDIRRGAKAVWAEFGAAQAINFGDFLLTLAPKPVLLASYPDAIKLKLQGALIDMSAAIANGQVAELELNPAVHTSELMTNYLACSAGKTSALFSGLARGVACIADKGELEGQLLTELFTPLGQIFQIQDDILDLYGDKGRGAIGCDIKEGKVSFLIACHLAQHSGDLAIIQPILAQPRKATTDEMVATVKALFDEKDTLSVAFDQLEQLMLTVDAAVAKLSDPRLERLVAGLISSIFKPIRHLQDHAKLDLSGESAALPRPPSRGSSGRGSSGRGSSGRGSQDCGAKCGGQNNESRGW